MSGSASTSAEKLGHCSRVGPSSRPRALARSSHVDRDLFFTFRGVEHSLDDFLAHHYVRGLLVVSDGHVVLERYGSGDRPGTGWPGFSMTKFVTCLLVGAAIGDGVIGAVEDAVTDYLPRLRQSAYDGVTIRHLLQMTSGVGWRESYRHPRSHLAQLGHVLSEGDTEEFLGFMARLNCVAEPGTRYNYNSGDVQLVGAVLRSAVGVGLGEYLGRSLWEPVGMEDEAWWGLTGGGDIERAATSLHASLRDWTRIGSLALAELAGTASSRLANGWVEAATRPGTANPNYGYFTYLRNGTFAAAGLYGQRLLIDPAARLVIGIQSSWPEPLSDLRLAMQQAVVSRITSLYGHDCHRTHC